MLEAAELIIAKYGIDGATLPRIAAAARMAPTSVYRRFRDKDGLIRAVFQRLSERTGAEIENQFVPEKGRSIGLVQFSRNVIVGYGSRIPTKRCIEPRGDRVLRAELGNNVCPAGAVGRSARVSVDDRLFLGLAR
jgi:AcrR family transcriptional regulator